jgi:hypothetical protein
VDLDVSTAFTHPGRPRPQCHDVLALCAHYAPDIIRFHPGPSKRRESRPGSGATAAAPRSVMTSSSARFVPDEMEHHLVKQRVAGDRTGVGCALTQ